MKQNQTVYQIWLFLGFIQIIFIQGCGKSAAQDVLFSGEPATNSTNTSSDRTGKPTAGEELQNLRVSRAFFERSLTGQVDVLNSAQNNKMTYHSKISWKELKPTAPAPTQDDVIADFRDRLGCATYNDLGEKFRLCFLIMPDVSSVGLSEDEVEVQGSDQFQIKNLKYVRAKQGEDSIEVTYLGESSEGPKLLQLKLRQL